VSRPKAVIIAGANGAGKTTFGRNVLPLDHPDCAFFLNVDEIQREAPQFASPFAAGREMLRRLAGHVARRETFAIETTLSSAGYARQIPDWRRAGYAVWLYYLEVESAELSIARVAQRVAAGGHGIPEADIRRRVARSAKLWPVYRGLVDVWYHLRVDAKGTNIVAKNIP
jgi:predicted ABC-type ATPase